MFTQEIISQINKTKYGSRSYTKSIFNEVSNPDTLEAIAEVVITTVATGLMQASPLTNIVRKVSARIHTRLQIEIPKDHSLLSFGIICVDWVAKAGLVRPEKKIALDNKGSVKEQWFLTSTSQEFTNYGLSISPTSTMLPVNLGVFKWTNPLLHYEDHRIGIVKKAERYGILGLYTSVKMPDVYSSLNRLGSQEFIINKSLLSSIREAEGYADSFLPRVVSEVERKKALLTLNDLKRKKRYIAELRFEEMHKWLLEETPLDNEILIQQISKKKADEKSQDYFDEKAEDILEVISDWSKRMDYEAVLKLAEEWKDEVINYLFNCDTRGRIYTIQHYLTPLGADIAKALLVFREPNQVSGYDLYVHIANCFGRDKLSFSDRVQWVNDNKDKLYAIGLHPWGNWELIKELELDGEDKTRWQGISACQVFVDFIEHMNEYNTEEGFMTNLIIGLDATASGTQILSILGRDDKVAPYVNITEPSTDKVGDFYTFLSDYLHPKMEAHRDTSKTLDVILDDWDSFKRILAKRNSMTFVYSGTKYGFGLQHWQDRKKYGRSENDTAGKDLTRADCRLIGNLMYEVCSQNIRGGAEIMCWLKDGINYHKGGAIISWSLPDGFTAFQIADKSKLNKIDGVIGNTNVSLGYYVFQDKPDVKSHKNGIAPNWVHSYDAYLLRLIVNGMPAEAPISTVHDQFSTSSYYIEELQATAKEAYKVIGNREEAERTCEEAFGVHRELPKVGNWELNEIDKAEFIIC